MRQERDDKRNPPTKDPNKHYYFDMIIKHIRSICAALVVFFGFVFLMFVDIDESVLETYKLLLCTCGGYLFGNANNK